MCTNHVTDYLPTLMLASYWRINDFRAISKSHLAFQCISINVLKLAFRVGFQMAGIMSPAKIKALLVSYSVIVKALLQYRHTINQACICYLWEILPLFTFPPHLFCLPCSELVISFSLSYLGGLLSRAIENAPYLWIVECLVKRL